MKKSSKIISLALSVTMAASCFTGFTICSASAADEETKVYFEVPTLESWGTTKSVYCHLYNVYGGSPLTETSWQAKSELCKKDTATGLYYFDTAKLGTIEDGADYALLFSTVDTEKGPHQTCNVTLGKDCLGDTVYVTGEMVENTENSQLLDFEGAWKNNSDKYGAKAAITSTGKIVGKYFPVYQPREQIVSQFLCSWAVTNVDLITPEIVQADCEELGVDPADVLVQYKSDYADKLADPENNPTLASVEAVAALLGVDPYPTEPITTEPVTTEPVTTEPVTTEPVTTEPVTTEPVTTEPVTTEPVTTEPVTTEPATTEPATDPEPQILYGDVDQDGIITIQDATLIQKIGLGIFDEDMTEEEFYLTYLLADVNGDGRVSILDVTYIQKYLVGGYKNTGLVGTPVVAVG